MKSYEEVLLVKPGFQLLIDQLSWHTVMYTWPSSVLDSLPKDWLFK